MATSETPQTRSSDFITLDETAKILGVESKSVSHVEGDQGDCMRQVKNIYLRSQAERIAKVRREKAAAKARAQAEKESQKEAERQPAKEATTGEPVAA